MARMQTDKIVEAMKQAAKATKKPVSKEPVKPFNPVIKPEGIKVRDMRQEAMDQGSHGAKEFFKEGQV